MTASAAASRGEGNTVAAAVEGAMRVQDETAGRVSRVVRGTVSANGVEGPDRLGSTALPTHKLTASAPATPSPSVTIAARSADSNICSAK